MEYLYLHRQLILLTRILWLIIFDCERALNFLGLPRMKSTALLTTSLSTNLFIPNKGAFNNFFYSIYRLSLLKVCNMTYVGI